MTIDITLGGRKIGTVQDFVATRMGKRKLEFSGSAVAPTGCVLGYTLNWGSAPSEDGLAGEWGLNSRAVHAAHGIYTSARSSKDDATITSAQGMWPSAIAYVEVLMANELISSATPVSPIYCDVGLYTSVGGLLASANLLTAAQLAALPDFNDGATPWENNWDNQGATISCSFASVVDFDYIRFTLFHNGNNAVSRTHFSNINIWYYQDP